jgi:SAM-dependent methyltransferase
MAAAMAMHVARRFSRAPHTPLQRCRGRALAGCFSIPRRDAQTAASVDEGLQLDVVHMYKNLHADTTDPFRPYKETLMRGLAERLVGISAPVVVDVGCAAGTDLGLLSSHLPPDARLIGVDKVREALVAARELLPSAEFVEGDLLRLPLEDGAVDGAYLSRVLLHVSSDLHGALSSLLRVLKPGGVGLVCEGDTRAALTLCSDDAVARAARAKSDAMVSMIERPRAAMDAYAALLRRDDVRDVRLEVRSVVAFDSARPAVESDRVLAHGDAQMLELAVKRGSLREADAAVYMAAIQREAGAPGAVQLVTLFSISFTKV